MKSVFLILTFTVFVFGYAHGTELEAKEKAFEGHIRGSFKDPVQFGGSVVEPGNGVLQVYQTTRNMVVTGLTKAHIRKVEADFKKGFAFLSYKAKRLTVHTDYELNGTCLLLPIWGKGKGVVVLDDVRVTANATVKLEDDKFHITGMKITFDMSDGSFALSSLFGETPPGILTPLYVKTFNANSRYIFNEILPNYIPKSEAALTKVWTQLLNSI
ncbi:hypothetical protein WA026_000406 [Henosepilachna vigintioctopunctata]|uniref:Secreted protein n=1 Tax=Henosepilachna vigintioctopunctata TaxID=420089 RepID=A0AAW1V3R1_9CUCU